MVGSIKARLSVSIVLFAAVGLAYIAWRVPADLYWADGYEGQNVFILPSKKLVIVKLSESQGDYLDDDKFLSDLIAALPQ